MSALPVFKKAVKYNAKGRVAIIGPSGSGKSFTALELATKLADGGKIVAVDTEHGSLSKYADRFEFDCAEPDSFSPESWLTMLDAAETAGYAVFITDSLSHYWIGKDGALEFVDLAGKRHKDNMGGWKEFRPHEREMVERMISSPMHIICTMRTKTDYVEEVNEKGKKVRRKIGLAPVQRDGLEYEFDHVAYMDDENNFLVEKTRCSDYRQKLIPMPKGKDFDVLAKWLAGGDKKPQPVQEQTTTYGVLHARLDEPVIDQPDPFSDKKAFKDAISRVVNPNQIKQALMQFKVRIEGKFGKEYGVIAIANAKASVGIPDEATVFDASLGDQKKVAILLFDELQRSTPTEPEKDGEDGNLLDYLEGIKADDIPSTLEVFKALKGHLFQTMGDGPGAFVYQSILKSYGVAHANGFKGEAKMEDARKAATEIYKKLQEELKKPTLADVPH